MHLKLFMSLSKPVLHIVWRNCTRWVIYILTYLVLHIYSAKSLCPYFLPCHCLLLFSVFDIFHSLLSYSLLKEILNLVYILSSFADSNCCLITNVFQNVSDTAFFIKRYVKNILLNFILESVSLLLYYLNIVYLFMFNLWC